MSAAKNILHDKVSLDTIRKYLRQEKHPDTGTPNELVERLAMIQEKAKADELAECDVCHGYSKMTYPECPYCGSSDEAPQPESGVQPKAEKPAKEKKAKGEKADKPAKAPKEKPAKESKAKEEPAPEPKSVPEAPKGKRKAKGKTIAEHVKEASAAAAIEKAAPQEILTEETLDAEVSAIKDAMHRGASCMWEVGQRLLRVRNENLHTLRKGDGAVPKYKTWDDFLKAEFEFSKVHAHRVMDVVERFSEEDVAKVGITKLYQLVGLKQSDQDALLEKAHSGASRSQIKAEVQRLGSSAKQERKDRSGRVVSERSKGKELQVPERSDAITAVVTNLTSTVQLYANGTEDTPARDPMMAHGIEKADNGVNIRYRIIRNEDGTFSLLVERSRD